MEATLELRCETKELQGLLSEILETLKRFPDVAHRVIETLHPFEELVSVELDYGAAAFTGEVVVRLDPSDRLRSLMAALRAG